MSTSDDDIRQAPPAPWARGMGNFMGNWLWLKEPSFGDDCSSDDEAEQYRDPWNYVPLAKTSGRKRAPSTMSERPAKGRKRAEEVNGGGAHGPESDDDCDELEGEVLKDEDMFARFTSEIVSGREFPSGEFDSRSRRTTPSTSCRLPTMTPTRTANKRATRRTAVRHPQCPRGPRCRRPGSRSLSPVPKVDKKEAIKKNDDGAEEIPYAEIKSILRRHQSILREEAAVKVY